MVNEFLPVRVVKTNESFFERKTGGGGEPSFFIEESDRIKHMETLSREIQEITHGLEINFKEFPKIPEIIKASLKKEAFAKSHRPRKILNEKTCPIIGMDQFGELLLETTEKGLKELDSKIKSPSNKYEESNITAIEKLELLDSKEKLSGLTVKELINKSQRKKTSYLKAILFNYKEEGITKEASENFIKYVEKMELQIENISGLIDYPIYRIVGADEGKLSQIVRHPSIKKLSFFPTYNLVTPKNIVFAEKKEEFPPPNRGEDYPIMGIIDSGISSSNEFLKPWVVHRKSFIPEEYEDTAHGTFVAGLACMGHKLNDEGICPNKDFIKLVDLKIIPKSDAEDKVNEDDLIIRLQESIPKILEEVGDVRIWNMSLGFKEECDTDTFSDLAIFLDKFQDKYNIIFTLPAGNYEGENQRTWPPQETNLPNFIQIPADSVRSITVGALACSENLDSYVKLNEPTSYSCKGPGPAFITKPELVHYSGNISVGTNGFSFTGQGIKSFGIGNNIVEDVGTSFSCPLIARTFSILHESLQRNPSNELIKALAIHKAYLPLDLGDLKIHHPHVGHGMPPKINEIVSCSPYESTLIFEQEIIEGYDLDYPFIWPKSLIDENGKCMGEVTMTLVAKTPLDENFGSEYIRTNVSVALQKSKMNKEGKKEWIGQVHETPDPCELNKYHESELIEQGYKWKPLKRYRKKFHRVDAEDWRIRVRVVLRDGAELKENVKFVLIFTIKDPKKTAPVYSEVIASLRSINLITEEINLKTKVENKVKLKISGEKVI